MTEESLLNYLSLLIGDANIDTSIVIEVLENKMFGETGRKLEELKS